VQKKKNPAPLYLPDEQMEPAKEEKEMMKSSV
jgi:hypothetical protein